VSEAYDNLLYSTVYSKQLGL